MSDAMMQRLGDFSLGVCVGIIISVASVAYGQTCPPCNCDALMPRCPAAGWHLDCALNPYYPPTDAPATFTPVPTHTAPPTPPPTFAFPPVTPPTGTANEAVFLAAYRNCYANAAIFRDGQDFVASGQCFTPVTPPPRATEVCDVVRSAVQLNGVTHSEWEHSAIDGCNSGIGAAP
jgi:hypothetical protein